MKNFLTTTFFLMAANYLFGQKLKIDTTTFSKWPEILQVSVTNNGRFGAYTLNNSPVGKQTVFIKALFSDWHKEFTASQNNLVFSPDNQYGILSISMDTVAIIRLGGAIEIVPSISGFKLPTGGNSAWVACLKNDDAHTLIVRNLATGVLKKRTNVSDYLFNHDGTKIAIIEKDQDESERVVLADLNAGTDHQIWQGKHVAQLIFDHAGQSLAFLTDGRDAPNAVWYYKAGVKEATKLIDGDLHVLDGFYISSLQQFDSTGENVLFKLFAKESIDTAKNNVRGPEIWGSSDPKLLNMREAEKNDQRDYAALVNIYGGKITFIEHAGEKLSSPALDHTNMLMTHLGCGDDAERYWNRTAKSSYFIRNLKTGDDKAITGMDFATAIAFNLSPDERYVVFYNVVQKNWFSYELQTGRVNNLTKQVKTLWTDQDNSDIPESPFRINGIAGWLNNGRSVLICSRYDLYQVDAEGKFPPINITNGYGARNATTFTMAFQHPPGEIINDKNIILSAFNYRSQESGFFNVTTGIKHSFHQLFMGPYIFNKAFSDDGPFPLPISAARDTAIYLVTRMNEKDASNLFVTHDFKSFVPITNIHPQNSYNWYTTQLITWKKSNGQFEKGILYKPDDFDPLKKYPMIVTFYEKRSDQLHRFITPDYSHGTVNIPWILNRGYLVFVPDISFKIGDPGPSIYNSVVSAIGYLKKFPWIDQARLGMNGESWGGFGINYLVTHTSIFAAAASVSGPVDLISNYGALRFAGSAEYLLESGQDRIAATLWQRPDLYIKNSPIFYVQNVTTPLLLVSNKKDYNVPFTQGVEFFLGLRRLGKTSWMLQYDNSGHCIGYDGNDPVDFTVRLSQFFDHYLQGAPAPKWMIANMPSKLKKTDNGTKPKAGEVVAQSNLLTDKQQKIVNSLSNQIKTSKKRLSSN